MREKSKKHVYFKYIYGQNKQNLVTDWIQEVEERKGIMSTFGFLAWTADQSRCNS